MEEAFSTFKSVVEADQWNGGPRKNAPWKKMKTLTEDQNRNRVWIKLSRDGKETKTRPYT